VFVKKTVMQILLVFTLFLFNVVAIAAPYKSVDARKQTDADGNLRSLSFCARTSPDTATGIPGHAFVGFGVVSQNGERLYSAVGHTTFDPAGALLSYSKLFSPAAGALVEEKYTSVQENCLVVLVNKAAYDQAYDMTKDYLSGQAPSFSGNIKTLLAYRLGAEDCVTFVTRTLKTLEPLGIKVPVRKSTELPLVYIRRVIESN
jgi:hypothetical protein